MTTGAFLAICVATAIGVLVIAATVLIAGPTQPSSDRQESAPASTSTPPHESVSAARCQECGTGLRLCRFHRGFAAGWTAARHHEIATAGRPVVGESVGHPA